MVVCGNAGRESESHQRHFASESFFFLFHRSEDGGDGRRTERNYENDCPPIVYVCTTTGVHNPDGDGGENTVIIDKLT